MYTSISLGALATTLLCALTPALALPAGEPVDAARRAPLSLPSTGSGTQLPAPNAPLQYILLGRGTQNYTCTGVGAVPVQLGAKANLYDLTNLARMFEPLVLQSPNLVVNLPMNQVERFTTAKFNYIGHHDFVVKGTPAFYLTGANKQIFVQKNAEAAAPASASAGPAKTGAVPWLHLIQSTTYTAQPSVGLSQVYRVATAGGKPYAACDAGKFDPKTGLMLVDYAALYYFY